MPMQAPTCQVEWTWVWGNIRERGLYHRSTQLCAADETSRIRHSNKHLSSYPTLEIFKSSSQEGQDWKDPLLDCFKQTEELNEDEVVLEYTFRLWS